MLVSIAVTPANPLINTGGTQQFTAMGTYSDNTVQNLTSTVTWSSTNTGTAGITAGGLATGAAKGSTVIRATLGAISGSTTLTVSLPLVSIAVTPSAPSIAKGATQQFTATGTFSDSSTQNITGSVTWSSSNTTVATVTPGGLAAAGAIGTTTIRAASGSISGTTGLNVTAAVLVSIAVTPSNPAIVPGGTQQFTATGTYSDATTQNLTAQVTWSSGTTAAATIAQGGLATGVATGSSTIQATLGSISGSTVLSISPSTGPPTTICTVDNGSGAVTSSSCSGTTTSGSAIIVSLVGLDLDQSSNISLIDSCGSPVWKIGSDFTNAGGAANAITGLSIASFVIPSVACSGINTFHVTWTRGAQYIAQIVTQWTGQAADPWDGSGFGATNSSTIVQATSTGSATNVNDLVYAICTAVSANPAAGSGFTLLNSSLVKPITLYKIGAGNSAASCTFGSSRAAVEVITLRPAGTYTTITRRQAASAGVINQRTCKIPITPTPGGTLLYLQGQVNGGYITVGLTDSGNHTWTQLVSLNQGAC
ncbi:MAG TPA: Ig-like domain-containing protein, partial [Candidatus Saccharimonadales bacterium]|nr:Ig-like domain-containing protein [Candidatus Saccharimonadales bacterium]